MSYMKLIAIVFSMLLICQDGQSPSEALKTAAQKREQSYLNGAAFLVTDQAGTKSKLLRFPEDSGWLISSQHPTEGEMVRIIEGKKFFSGAKKTGDENWAIRRLETEGMTNTSGILLDFERKVKAPWSLLGTSVDQVLKREYVSIVRENPGEIIIESNLGDISPSFANIPFSKGRETARLKVDSERRVTEYSWLDGGLKDAAISDFQMVSRCQMIDESNYTVTDAGQDYQVEVIEHDWNDRSVLKPENYGFSWPTESTANNQPAGYLMYYLLGGGALFLLLGLYLAYRRKQQE